ncbi:hypothetical protein DSM02_3224, partial [Leeuwenhoekiella polynyae]
RVTLILYIIAVSFKVALFDRNSWHHYSEIATSVPAYHEVLVKFAGSGT